MTDYEALWRAYEGRLAQRTREARDRGIRASRETVLRKADGLQEALDLLQETEKEARAVVTPMSTPRPADDSLPLGWHEHDGPPAGVHQHGEYALHAHIDFAAPYAATGLAPQRPSPQQQREQMAAYAYAAAIVNDPVAMREGARELARELERAQWVCGGCGWEWPTAGPPPPGAGCQYCSGYLLPRTGEGTP